MSQEPVVAPAPEGKAPQRRSVFSRFAAIAIGAMVGLTVLWWLLAPWVTYPVGVLSGFVLEQTVPMWVRSVEVRPGEIAVSTAVDIPIPNGGGRKAAAKLIGDPARFAYGLPILLALLLASWAVTRRPGIVKRALLGYVLLLPAQAFSLVMFLLMQLAAAAKFDIRALRVEAWQTEALAFGFQVGSLMLPTLVPVLVWLLLDRTFFMDVIVHGWRQSFEGRGRLSTGDRGGG